VTVIDTAPAIARRLEVLLQERGLLNSGTEPGSVHFYSSGNVAEQTELFSRLWGENVAVTSLPAGNSAAVPLQNDT